MMGTQIQSIKYHSYSMSAKDIRILFTDVSQQLHNHNCKVASVKWDSNSCETYVQISNGQELLQRVESWDHVCPDKALAYVFTNIE